MATVSVAALDLALRLPGAMRADASAAERRTRDDFIPALLRSLERKLAGHYGEDAVIRICRLDFTLRASASELAAPDFAEMLAGDLADSLRRRAVICDRIERTASVDAPLTVYPGPAHHAAARLVAATRRAAGPTGAAEAPDRVWSDVRRLPRATAAQAVRLLFEAKCLRALVAALPPAALDAMRRELGPVLPVEVWRILAGAPEPAGVARRPESAVRARGPKSTGEARRPKSTREPPRLDADAEPIEFPVDPAVVAVAVEPGDPAPARARPARPRPSRPDRAVPRRSVAPPTWSRRRLDAGANATDRAADRATPSARSIEPLTALPPAGSPTPLADPERSRAALAAQQDAPPPSPTASDADLLHLDSAWCGLAYLLRIALLCDLPEQLWQIGVDEGAVLARALGCVAGVPDPAWLVLSDRYPGAPVAVGPVPGWALDELRAGALETGRRLLARRDIDDDLDATIAAWLVRLDAPAEHKLCRWIAAFLLAMFGALTDSADAGGAAAAQLAMPGVVTIGPDAITISQPIAQIDLAVRRAGLDADPGWLAWRNVSLRLAFVGGEDAA